jgi:hypothetical protein
MKNTVCSKIGKWVRRDKFGIQQPHTPGSKIEKLGVLRMTPGVRETHTWRISTPIPHPHRGRGRQKRTKKTPLSDCQEGQEGERGGVYRSL